MFYITQNCTSKLKVTSFLLRNLANIMLMFSSILFSASIYFLRKPYYSIIVTLIFNAYFLHLPQPNVVKLFKLQELRLKVKKISI